jgi:hypothetical protein
MAAGDTSGALGIYKALWDLLAKEYDIEPSKETQELIAAVKLAPPTGMAASDLAQVDDGEKDQKPKKPLPPPVSATRFRVVRNGNGGQIDVVPPVVWLGQEIRAKAYYTRSLELVESLNARLVGKNALPDLVAAIPALQNVLGTSLGDVQPDQLRLARSLIAAKAQAYGHPQAEWETSPDVVSDIFELSMVLGDLEGFASSELKRLDEAIQLLNLAPEKAAAAKDCNDALAEFVANIGEATSARVRGAFDSEAKLSASASDAETKMAIEGARVLMIQNLGQAIATELALQNTQAVTPGHPPTPSGTDASSKAIASRKRSRGTRAQPAATTNAETGKTRPLDNPGQPVLADAFRRFCKRILDKAPEKWADDVIRHAPKAALGGVTAIGSAIGVWAAANPIVMAGGAVAITAAWVAYELRQMNRRK